MITYQDIEQANQKTTSVDIKGKDYIQVNERIKAFRMLHPLGTISSEILSHENGVVIIKAYIFNGDGLLLGTGLAYEKENSTFINKTSYIENCETSAVGRALGMCGFGIDTSIASAEEVQTAIINQEQKTNKQKAVEVDTTPVTPQQINDIRARYSDEEIKRMLSAQVFNGRTLTEIYQGEAERMIKARPLNEKSKN